MATVVDLSDLALSEMAWRFDGKEHGSSVSFFVTAHEYGAVPRPADDATLTTQP